MPLIHIDTDKKIRNRFTSLMYQWLNELKQDPIQKPGSISLLEGFQLTADDPSLWRRWRMPWQIDLFARGLLKLSIPAFVPAEIISAPRGTVSVVCEVAAASYDLKRQLITEYDSKKITVDNNRKQVAAQIISLNLPAAKGSLMISAPSLQFMAQGKMGLKPSEATNAQPSGILSAVYL